jgi:hypothetical protein
MRSPSNYRIQQCWGGTELSLEDQGSIYELRQQAEENGITYSKQGIRKLVRVIVKIRREPSTRTFPLGGGSTCTVSLGTDEHLILEATQPLPTTPGEFNCRERSAARAKVRGKVERWAKPPQGSLPRPLVGWKISEKVVVQGPWYPYSVRQTPDARMSIVDVPFVVDIEQICKVPLHAYWSIVERLGIFGARFLVSGVEVPAKATHPEFRARFLPEAQKGKVAMDVVDVGVHERLTLEMIEDRLVVFWEPKNYT